MLNDPMRGNTTEPDEGERETAVTPSWSAKRVLLVQENNVIRHVVGSTLRRHGYVVIDVSTMEDAIAYARRGMKIDIVLSDFARNEISGPELLLRLQRFVPSVRAIFIGPSDRARRRPTPQSAPLLSMPFGVGDLLTALRQVMGGFFN